MCLSCGKHVAARLWYLEPEAHRARGPLYNLVDRWVDRAMIFPGLETVKHRQPYGTERWTGVSRALWDWLTAAVHGVQVLPDLESSFKIIDMAHEIGLARCACREVLLDEGENAPWRCLSLNNRARVLAKENGHNGQEGRIISKDEAKELVAQKRQEGCLQSAGWRMGANLAWLCNCDEGCGAHRAPELQWGMIPSFFIARVTPSKCTGCGECLSRCSRRAITIANGAPEIDEATCWGCGLCVENCPEGAIRLYPRSRYYDVAERRIVELPAGKLAV